MSATASRRSAGSARRVVACEPNPPLVKTLRLLYGRDASVTIEPVAVGAAPGEIELQDQHRQSDRLDRLARFRAKPPQGAPGWQGQVWDKSIARRR